MMPVIIIEAEDIDVGSGMRSHLMTQIDTTWRGRFRTAPRLIFQSKKYHPALTFTMNQRVNPPNCWFEDEDGVRLSGGDADD